MCIKNNLSQMDLYKIYGIDGAVDTLPTQEQLSAQIKAQIANQKGGKK